MVRPFDVSAYSGVPCPGWVQPVLAQAAPIPERAALIRTSRGHRPVPDPVNQILGTADGNASDTPSWQGKILGVAKTSPETLGWTRPRR